MLKSEFNSKFRKYVQESISITQENRVFITLVYESFQKLLGGSNTLQIGSYPRFTAIKPLHDLDILYIIGGWNEQNHNPEESLKELLEKIKQNYCNPTNYAIEISLQTHSVTVVFKSSNGDEKFSVDIIPAYIFSKNEFQQDTYKIPEVIRHKHGKKREYFYENISMERKKMNWIHTDPRSYITVAKQVNQSNDDFIQTVKFIKAWKNSCKEKDDNFKLKSFHIEQVITGYFQNKSDLTIFDAVFKFFVAIPQIIEAPKIIDRVNSQKFIDEYLNDLTLSQTQIILQAKDCFLKN